MKEKKLTDEEIVKALAVCMYDNNGCANCPCYTKNSLCVCSSDTDGEAVLNLINGLKRKNVELQKQVDELKAEKEDLYFQNQNLQTYIDNHENIWKRNTEQAVKDTAKEILTELIEKAHSNACIDLTVNEVKAWFREDYGVEVE